MARRIPQIITGILILIAAVWGVRRYLHGRTHVVTDNAQVDGRLLPVASRVQGYVGEVRVDDNQLVKTGDTLLVLDDRDLAARVRAARADLDAALALTGNHRETGQLVAQLEAARATASSADAGVISSAAAVASAEARLRQTASDLDRIRGLAAKKIVAAQQLDAAQTAFDAAAAAVEAARAGEQAARRQAAASQAQVGVADAAIKGADARVAALRAALDNAELQQSWTVITAPFDAVVSRRMVEKGALLQPGQTTMTLIPANQTWVTANVKETYLSRITPGDSVSFTVDGYGKQVFSGRVASIAPVTGAKVALLPPDNATGNFTKVVQTIPVRIAVSSAVDPSHPLRPGMSVEVSITVGR